MRRATDSALKGRPTSTMKSTFFITPVLTRLPLKEIIRKVTPGRDFSIWGYKFFSLYCLFTLLPPHSLALLIFFYYSYCDEAENLCNIWAKGHLYPNYASFFSFEKHKQAAITHVNNKTRGGASMFLFSFFFYLLSFVVF
jgi:hypothetical protein